MVFQVRAWDADASGARDALSNRGDDLAETSQRICSSHPAPSCRDASSPHAGRSLRVGRRHLLEYWYFLWH